MPDCRKAAPLALLWAVTLTAGGGGGGNEKEFRRNEFAASVEHFPQYRQAPAEPTRALAWLRPHGEF